MFVVLLDFRVVLVLEVSPIITTFFVVIDIDFPMRLKGILADDGEVFELLPPNLFITSLI